MKKQIILFWLLTAATATFAQNEFRIFGFVSDGQNGEKLIGATIYDTVSQKGVITDNNGYFSLTVRSASHLHINYIGYLLYEISLQNCRKDTLVQIKMKTNPLQLGEAVISARKNPQPQVNVVSLSRQEMDLIPSIGSKPDVMRQLQLLPGIAMQNESSSSLLVRGGDPGQNLYLLDNIPLIYVNHLGGFFSVFNPDIINQIDVYKGGFPA
ncbi:MAG: carboxypeptidase-like regulatory domain-containing protein, partial [Clostridiales bacterium]|nr:carboxypeptidase-like regulatory domain-containing protein [Clostridiales bacterium]